MSIWGRFAKWLFAEEAPEQKAHFSRYESIGGPFPEPTFRLDTDDYAEAVANITERHYLVYAAQKKSAESLARLPFKVYKLDSSGDRMEADRSDKWRMLFSRPNDYQDGFEFFEGTVYSLFNGGEFFWEVVGGGRELHLLRPDKMKEVIDPKRGLVGWIFNANDNQFRYEASEIIHGHFYNPLNRWRGLSPLAALRLQIESDLEAQTYNRNFYRNSSVAQGVLETTEYLEDSDYDRIRGQWEKAHKGSARAHRVGILEQGLQWKPTTISQKDSDFVEQQKLSREAILTVFQVPPAILGLYEYANYANSESQIAIYYREGIGPLARRIERAVARILPLGYMAEFEFHEMLRPSFREQQEGYTAAINTGYLSRNEVRRLENKPPVDGGDELFVPVNTMPLSRILAGPGPAEGGDQPAPEDQQGKKSITRQKKGLDRSSPQFGSIVARLQAALQSAMDSERERVAERLSSGDLVGALESVLGPEDAALMRAAAEPGMREAVLYGARSGEDSLIEMGFPRAEPNVRALGLLPDMLSRFASDVTDTTVAAIRDEIRIGMANGEDIAQLTRRVRTYYDTEGAWRAEAAARTESARAYVDGRLDTYRQNGVERKQWIFTEGDEERCSNGLCPENDGRIIGTDELFYGGLDGPPAHPNCKCDVVAVI